MVASSHFAVQYIRMSTDKQDLSPSVQKEAIAAYAAARGMEIVVSYEDEGRSGVHLKNRPGLLKLLHDITDPKRFLSPLRATAEPERHQRASRSAFCEPPPSDRRISLH
jgi:Resolvase, N terminal domain